MKEIIKAAEETLLAPADLTVTNLQTALQNNMDGLDWADIYAQERMSESWLLEDGKLKPAIFRWTAASACERCEARRRPMSAATLSPPKP